MLTKSFDELFKEAKKSDSYWAEKTILDFTIELHQLMKRRGISKKELAEKLGKSQPYITKILRGNVNFTIESMVKLVRVLDGELNIHVTPKEEKGKSWFRVLETPQNGKRKAVAHKAWAGNLSVEDIPKEEISSEMGIG